MAGAPSGRAGEKKKAEKEKEKKAKQAAAAKQSFRNKKPEASSSRKDSGYSGNQQQQTKQVSLQPRTASSEQAEFAAQQGQEARQPQAQEERRWRRRWTPEMTINIGILPCRGGEGYPSPATIIRIPVGIHQFPASFLVSDHYTSQGHQQEIGAHRDQATSPKERNREGPSTASFLPVQFFPHHKEIGRMETILNLRPLNQQIKPRRFKMESLAAVLPELKKGWWGATLDLKDAYLHLP